MMKKFGGKLIVFSVVFSLVIIIFMFGNFDRSTSNFKRNTSEISIINTLSIKSFFEGIIRSITGGSKLTVDHEVTMLSNNVCNFSKATGKSEKDYCVNLHANVYYSSKKTKNWALLVHGNMMSANSMASAVGKMYIDNNINILAIDLRGFGDSKGSVAMGFLESLDVMDWLDFLNSSDEIESDRRPEKILIHGISLGGATTIQTLTMGGLDVSGIGEMPSISSKNVVGVVDDCGYTSMNGIITSMLPSVSGSKNTISSDSKKLFGNGSGFSNWGIGKDSSNGLGALGNITLNGSNTNLKDNLIKTVLTGNLIKTGLSTTNFELYQDAFGNNRTADKNVKVMVIHGGGDTTVPPTNADVVIKNSNVVETYRPDGSPHAFIVVGQHKTEYTEKVNSFVEKLSMGTKNDATTKDNSKNGFIGKLFGNLFKK